MVVVGVIGAQESGGGGRRGGGGRQRPEEVGPWIHIGEDGKITAFTGKAEVGQNTRTALTQGVAEEMRVPVDWVRLVMGDTDRTPDDAGTFGSRSMPDMLPQMRKAAASARELLIDRAAGMLAADRQNVRSAEGKVTDLSTGKSVGYGDIVQGHRSYSKQRPSARATLTAPADWKVMGRAVPKVDGRDFVTGVHKYTTDVKLPGMLYGMVVRPPLFGATIASMSAPTVDGVTVARNKDFSELQRRIAQPHRTLQPH